MKLQNAVMQCNDKKCGEQFISQLLVDCDIKLFCAALKDMRCLKCNGHNLSLVSTEDCDE